MRFEGKVAVVTGGGSGIGRATCQRFAQEGASICVADIDTTAANETVFLIERLGGRALAVEADVSLLTDARKIVEAAVGAFGSVHILVNNAASFLLLDALEADAEHWDRSFAVNVKGAALVAKFAVAHMAAAGGGAIVNIGSINSLMAEADMAPYNTTKAALIGLTRSMAVDYAEYNVRSNAVCPGIVYTPTVARMLHEQGMTRQQFEKTGTWMGTPGMRLIIKRIAEAEEIAAAVLFLASDDASYITGTYLLVDGGNMAQ